MIDTIHPQSGHLVTLLNELLDLARIESRAGKDFHIEAQDILPIIRNTLAELLVPGDSRRVNADLPGQLPEVAVDAEKMQLTLTNVLSNAVENRNGVITFFLDKQREKLEELMRLYTYDQLKSQTELEKIFSAISPWSFVDLGLIDSTGKHIAYVGPYRAQLLDKTYEKAPWFHEVMMNGTYINDIFLGFRNVPHFIIAVADPLRNWTLRATINSRRAVTVQLPPGSVQHDLCLWCRRSADFHLR